ncbi:MAG TPA: hypothetical protein VJW94_14620 [Candidatus Acidoferrum sp.]|nr:hypothetical protein [Candidatus Acidoferrum sp.]
MLVKFLNGKEEHLPLEVARGFIASGQAEEIIPPVKKADWSNHWSLEVVGLQHPVLTLCLRRHTQVQGYTGHPDAVNERVEWPGGGRWRNFGVEVPREWVKEYSMAWEKNRALRGPWTGSKESDRADVVAAAERCAAELKARYEAARG